MLDDFVELLDGRCERGDIRCLAKGLGLEADAIKGRGKCLSRKFKLGAVLGQDQSRVKKLPVALNEELIEFFSAADSRSAHGDFWAEARPGKGQGCGNRGTIQGALTQG